MYHTGSFEQYSFFTGISDGSFCRWGLFGTLVRGAMFYLSADHRDRISGGYFPGTHPLFRQKQQLTAFDDHAGSAFVMGLLVGNSIGNVSNAVSMHKDQSEIIRAICANYSFGRMYQNGVVENNGAFFFLFLVASSVWFLFFFLFMLVAYQEIVLALRAPKVYKTFSYGTQEAKTKHRALEERLWSQWIHSRSYMVSTLIGPMYALMSECVLPVEGAGDQAIFIC